jgi:hypothetical protein
MVQADQVKNRQPPALLDMLQRFGGERDRYLSWPSLVIWCIQDRLAKPEAVYIKTRRHDAQVRGRFPFPTPP